MARRSHYLPPIADRFVNEVLRGRTLRAICRDEGMPTYGAVRQWVREDREGFAVRCRRARKAGNAKIGRATCCTPEIVERLLHELSRGRTLISICYDPGMPGYSTVRQWVTEDRDGFAARYRAARKIGNPGTGRPTLYTPEIADRILDELSNGRALAAVCGDPGMPLADTVRHWARENREGFAERYRDARRFGIHIVMDRMTYIADDSCGDWVLRRTKSGKTRLVVDTEHIRRCRRRVMALRRHLTTLLPRTYDDLVALMDMEESHLANSSASSTGSS